jgi:hypothetical protein
MMMNAYKSIILANIWEFESDNIQHPNMDLYEYENVVSLLFMLSHFPYLFLIS